MSLIVVDVESDGPIPHKYSMVCFGAVIVDKGLNKTFYGKTKSISELWVPEALAVSGFTREEHLNFEDPKTVMENFKKWIEENSKGRPILITDNPAYDFAWINWYFHYYLGSNPFGFSARRIGDIICGLEEDFYYNWKHLRKTRHTHHPVDDAKGNAEAVIALNKKYGMNLPIK